MPSPFFWYYSVTTEQYTSAVLQTLLVIWLAFRWDERPRDSTLLWLVFLSGTMLANMVTTLFILPPLLGFIFTKQNPSNFFQKPKLILQAVGLACLPLLSYTYVFISGALHPEWRGAGEWPTAWAWFVDFLTIPQGRDELTPGLGLQNFFTAEFPALMWQELTWPIFVGGLVGLAFLGKRRALFLYSTLLIYFVFCWLYRFGNWFQVIIPAYPIFIIGVAAGMKRIDEWRMGSGEETKRRGGEEATYESGNTHYTSRFTLYALRLTLYILPALLITLLLYRFSTNLPRADQSHLSSDTGLDPGWAILADQPAPLALISSDFPEQVALHYLTNVWGATSAVYPTNPGDLTSPGGQTARLSRYITRQAAVAAPEAVRLAVTYPQAAGEQLIALWPAPRTELPATALPLDLPFDDALKLAGWEQVEMDYPLPPDVARRLPRANWQIALYWQTSQPLREDYTISVRPLIGGQLINESETALIQDHQPVWGVYPTSRWRPGEVVRDVYALTLPEGLTPEAVQIVVYKTTNTGFENLAEGTIVTR